MRRGQQQWGSRARPGRGRHERRRWLRRRGRPGRHRGAGVRGALGRADNLVDQFFADPERNPWDASGPDAASADDYADAARACYATPDACGDAECGAFASCCVNNGTCCEPILDDPPLPAVLDFRQCAGQTVDSCAEGVGSNAVAFGELEPVITGRGLVPNGTATAEGGALIGEPSEPLLAARRGRCPVHVAGWMQRNLSRKRGRGVHRERAGGVRRRGVGLLLSGSREVVNLMIGNAVADSFDAGTDNTQWRLVLSPEGSAQVFRDGNSVGTYAFDAAALERAQFVAFGRNLGAAATSAAIAIIEVQSSFCDNPQLVGRPTASLDRAQRQRCAWARIGKRAVDRRPGARRRMAYEVDGEIFVSEEDAPGEFFLSDSNPALVPTEPYEAMGVGDPELVWDGNFLLLFYTARDATGVGSIGVAMSTEEPPVFMNSDAPGAHAQRATWSPTTPRASSTAMGFWLLVVRATLSSGATELHAFYTSNLDTAGRG